MSAHLDHLEARLRVAESIVQNIPPDEGEYTYAVKSLIDGMRLLIVEVKELKKELSTTSYRAYRAYSRR